MKERSLSVENRLCNLSVSDRVQQPGLGNGEGADSFRHDEVDDPGQGDK